MVGSGDGGISGDGDISGDRGICSGGSSGGLGKWLLQLSTNGHICDRS